jgi:hypothetical protein
LRVEEERDQEDNCQPDYLHGSLVNAGADIWLFHVAVIIDLSEMACQPAW